MGLNTEADSLIENDWIVEIESGICKEEERCSKSYWKVLGFDYAKTRFKRKKEIMG